MWGQVKNAVEGPKPHQGKPAQVPPLLMHMVPKGSPCPVVSEPWGMLAPEKETTCPHGAVSKTRWNGKDKADALETCLEEGDSCPWELGTTRSAGKREGQLAEGGQSCPFCSLPGPAPACHVQLQCLCRSIGCPNLIATQANPTGSALLQTRHLTPIPLFQRGRSSCLRSPTATPLSGSCCLP